MDELGYVSWDENHRNGQLDQVPWLIKRDRNHPSVTICKLTAATILLGLASALHSSKSASDTGVGRELLQ